MVFYAAQKTLLTSIFFVVQTLVKRKKHLSAIMIFLTFNPFDIVLVTECFMSFEEFITEHYKRFCMFDK